MKFLVVHLIMKETRLLRVLRIIHVKFGRIQILLSFETAIFIKKFKFMKKIIK